MEYAEYAERNRALEAERARIDEERQNLRKETLKTAFRATLQAQGIDPSWASIVTPESESDIPRLVNELRARGVGPSSSFSAVGIGSRLAAVERAANEQAEAAKTYFGEGE